MPKFRKKPVEIDAVRFTGDNKAEIRGFVGDKWEDTVTESGVQTLEGFMRASPGDWIIRGVNGEFYPCKPDIFKKTYDPA